MKEFSKRKQFRKDKPKDEFDSKLLGVARVARVVAGGRRFSFRSTVVIGDKKGRVGVGVGKGPDVADATGKATAKAKKNLIKIDVSENTIPHEVYSKFCSAKVFLKPAKKGRGIVAGGVVRAVVNLGGIKDITSKILGSANKLNNARATILALKKLKIKNEKIKTTDKN